jgi:transposase
MSLTTGYPTDLTDTQWMVLKDILPKPKTSEGESGRPPMDLRHVINGILYLNKTGCQWRMLPKEFGHWNSIYHYFNNWNRLGVWYYIMMFLNQKERIKKKEIPTLQQVV